MKKRLRQKSKIILYTLTVLFVVLIIWTIWGNQALMVNTFTISSHRIPAAFSGFRIAQISDLHNTEFGEHNTTLLTLLSKSKPDIIVITGDLIDAHHTNIDIALDFAKEAIQIAPTYYVTGNHEANSSQYHLLQMGLKETGIIVLEDEAIPLEYNREKITLIGLSDPNFIIKGDMFGEIPDIVLKKLRPLIDNQNSYHILLSHRPELFECYASCNIDLIFSGHAHGGQFRLPFIGGLIAPNQGFFPKYDAGLYTDGNTHMIVSRGIGNSIIPFRLNNRPEIILLELNSKKNKGN